jgi:hypothetical protein
MTNLFRTLSRLFLYFILFTGPISYASHKHVKAYKYTLLKKQYPWMNKHIYAHIQGHAPTLRIENPEFFIAAIIQAESQGYRRARSKVGARGLMQVMGFWVPKKRVKDLYKPSYNIRTGTRILVHYHKLARGNLRKTLKNYNSGPGSSYYNTPYINRILKQYYTLNNQMKIHTLYTKWLITP